MNPLVGFRRLQRTREIIGVLTRHGLGALIDQLGLTRWRGPVLGEHSAGGSQAIGEDPRKVGVRIRQALQALGPTFIKLGQIASLRADLFPPDILRELEKLQDRLPPFPFETVKSQIESELQAPLHAHFSHVESQPLAAASIGQVHAARLRTGEEVVIKVQRPGAAQTVEADLDILLRAAEFAERHSPWSRVYPIREVALEIAHMLREELDYLREGVHADRLREATRDIPGFHLPKVYWDQTTSRILTLERLRGTKLAELPADALEAGQGREIARRLILGMLEQIFLRGCFHADPHPGNLLVMADGRIGLLDFGVVGTLDEETRLQLGKLVWALTQRDLPMLTGTVLELVDLPETTDLSALQRDLAFLRDRYYRRTLKDLELGEVLRHVFGLLQRHGIRLPPDLTLVAKALMTLEGIGKRFDPDLSLLEMAEPIGRRFYLQNFTPAGFTRRARDQLVHVGLPLLEIPGLLRDALREGRRGRPLFRVDLGDRESLRQDLSRFVNRLSLSILLLSFSILLGALLLAGAIAGGFAPPQGAPIFQVGVAFLAVAVIALLLAIFRSGRI